jgi:predicted DsbA family dithiol-disulfide isomerase
MGVVHTVYYTDPACPWSWALEPSFRRLMCEFAGSLEVEYVMAGLVRELEDPEALAVQSLEASASSQMPVDARGWLLDPPRSSHPACIAVLAAAEQGDPGPYLRRLREGFFCRRRRLDGADALIAEAQALGGLDLQRLRIDLGSHALLERFGAHLERARAGAGERHASGDRRVKLPSLEFRDERGTVHDVQGFASYEELRAAALGAGAVADEHWSAPGVLEALGRFRSMATVEVASVCRLPGPRAPLELWRLAAEWQVKVERVVGGELWSLP